MYGAPKHTMKHLVSEWNFVAQGLKSLHVYRLAGGLWLLLFALICQAETVSPHPPVKVLILGDSLSAGYGIPLESSWVSLLEQQIDTSKMPTSIINASISGETTGGGRQRLPTLLEKHHPDITIIELGGNDGLRGFPLNVIRQNLAAMVELVTSQNSQALLVGMRIPPNYGPDYTEGFFSLYTDLASEYQVPVVPFFLEGVALNPDLMQNDGIHPNADGQPMLLANINQALQPLLQQSR